MPKAYLIGHISVTDPDSYADYVAQVPAIIKAAGGRYLVRGGATAQLEGEMPGARTVVIEFNTLDAAQSFYNSEAYKEIISIRHGASDGGLILVKGIEE